ncbi:MAG: hypothetical protein FWB88_09595 [Defluviitaleaceae bacterium]|nr:hypothetical protein [Defluviitaleaceae bacterium]MCL2239711.1 hypothetical protein [Defluviitaleaceae bacterium]
MSHFLSKINRGLALGMVMLMGLAVYFIADARAFRGEPYAIWDTIVAFVDAVEELNREVSPGAQEDFVDRFYTEFRMAGWHPAQPSLLTRAEAALDTFAQTEGAHLPAPVAFHLTQIADIHRQASHMVRVQFSMQVNFPVMEREAQASFFNGFAHVTYGMVSDYMRVDALLIRSGGVWRFATAQVRPGLRGYR